jgi:tRNA (guanine-N7-)-methyltransferase
MARTKLKRLTKVDDLPNVFSLKHPAIKEAIKHYFNSNKLFTIEIGCGQGDYSVDLAQKFPDRNFIGIDVKGARIFHGATKALDLNLHNVAFLIAKAENLAEIFDEKSIEEIYIPFPDPHFRRANQNRRLISKYFLNVYKQLLTNSGLIHFKTDNQLLYDYAMKIISDYGCTTLFTTEHLYEKPEVTISANVMTSFEKHYVKARRKIMYICFKF